MLKRLRAWWNCDAFLQAAIQATAARAFQDGHQVGYHVGLAHGELIGRQRLAQEVEARFGYENHNEMQAEDALRIRVSQLH